MAACARDTIESRDLRGRTALLVACDAMQAGCVKVLLSAGADALAQDASGQSTAAAALAACGAQQAQLTDSKSRAALQQRCLDIIKLLFQPSHIHNPTRPRHSPAASLVSHCPPSRDPLIVAAARSGLHDIVCHLLDTDPSQFRAKGQNGHTVLDVYLAAKSSAGLDLLQRRGLLSAMDYASAPRRNAGFDPACTLKPFWQARR